MCVALTVVLIPLLHMIHVHARYPSLSIPFPICFTRWDNQKMYVSVDVRYHSYVIANAQLTD